MTTTGNVDMFGENYATSLIYPKLPFPNKYFITAIQIDYITVFIACKYDITHNLKVFGFLIVASKFVQTGRITDISQKPTLSS